MPKSKELVSSSSSASDSDSEVDKKVKTMCLMIMIYYDCINIYVSKYVSFHIIYRTLGKNIIRACVENILFALQ